MAFEESDRELLESVEESIETLKCQIEMLGAILKSKTDVEGSVPCTTGDLMRDIDKAIHFCNENMPHCAGAILKGIRFDYK